MISNPYNSFHWKKVANHVSHRSYYRIPNKSIPSKKTTKCVMFVLHLFMVNTLNYPIFSALYIPVISQKIRTKTTMCASEIPMNPTKSQVFMVAGSLGSLLGGVMFEKLGNVPWRMFQRTRRGTMCGFGDLSG